MRSRRAEEIQATQQLPECLDVKGVQGILKKPAPGATELDCVVVWLSPRPDKKDVQPLASRLNGLKVLQRYATFEQALVLDGFLGIQFQDAAEAQDFVSTRRGKMKLGLPGQTVVREYTLHLEGPPGSTDGDDLMESAKRRRADSQPSSRKRPQVFVKPTLEPLGSDVVRIFVQSGQHHDVPIGEGDTMAKVYQLIRESCPGCVLAKLPESSEVLLPQDLAVSCELLVVEPASLPLVLPTEFQVQLGPAGEREVDFALLKHLLCEVLGDFNCLLEQGSESAVGLFQHRTELCGRNRLVILKSAVQRLDTLVQHKKMAFVSVVGKPREGKSTLLELMRRRCSGKAGGQLFRCSNSATHACTTGLWVSTQVLSPNEKEKDTAVLFLDTEGLFADDGTDSDYFIRLFTVTCVLSSVLILNNKICNTVAEEFKSSLARLAVHYKGFFERNTWFKDHRPRVLYLARDWNEVQSLEQDCDDWQEAELRSSSEQGPLHEAMQFIRDAFGVVKFGTLPSPLTELCKKDVVLKELDPQFEQKLDQILSRYVWPHLSPKSFEDSSRKPCFLTGAGPLLELLQSTVDAVSTEISLDWQTTLQRFREKAALTWVDGCVQSLSTEVMRSLNYVDFCVRPEICGISDSNLNLAASALKEVVSKAAATNLQTREVTCGSLSCWRVSGPLKALRCCAEQCSCRAIQKPHSK